MENKVQITMHHAGMAERSSLTKKLNYIAPDITMVEFKVEHCMTSLTDKNFGITSVNRTYNDDYTPTSQDGTESYNDNNTRVFF